MLILKKTTDPSASITGYGKVFISSSGVWSSINYLGVITVYFNTSNAYTAHDQYTNLTSDDGHTQYVLNDPYNQTVMFDDFCGNSSKFVLGWSVSGTGTPAPVYDVAGETGSNGVLCLAGTALNYVAMYISGFYLSQGAVEFTWRIRIPTLSNSGGRFTVDVGLLGGTGTTLTNGVYFSYTDNSNSGKWTCTCNRNTSTTTRNTTIAATTNWVTLKAVINAAATAADFYIDGVLACTTITTNIPNTISYPCGAQARSTKVSGTTTSNLYIDYFYAIINMTR